MFFSLWKQAYSNILKVLQPKQENFQIKNSNIFHISAQNIDCGYSLEMPQWGSSDEYQQSMFMSRNKKNNVYPCKPQFYYIKVRFKGVKIIYYIDVFLRCIFHWVNIHLHCFNLKTTIKYCRFVFLQYWFRSGREHTVWSWFIFWSYLDLINWFHLDLALT